MAESWHIPRASLGSISSGSRRSSIDGRRGISNRAFDGQQPPTKARLNELRERFDDSSRVVPKRGSRSSQGSSDSAHSSHSAGSGSLLLTAANLENFAKIHHHKQYHPAYSIHEEEEPEGIMVTSTPYQTNITLGSDGNLDHLAATRYTGKTKDIDTISMASSTHFTVVNGIGRPPKVPKSGLCDHGHQITVLIVTMSIFFMIGICAAIYFMESK